MLRHILRAVLRHLLWLSMHVPCYAESAILETHSLHQHVALKSWKTLRDTNIVKQDKDYSCGAASLATVLNYFYGQSLSEAVLLKVLGKGELRASFEDMQRVLPQFGFRAVGYALSYEQLTRLKIPVVLYLKHRKDDHFSVLRGIDTNTVWLADPTLGNRTYSREQFLLMWHTRGDARLAGKILAILPLRADVDPSETFFMPSLTRQSRPAIEQLHFRLLP
jgi:predicted double-glycine peptidase